MADLATYFMSYGSGLLAALSPCVIVLVPLVLYRFTVEKVSSTTTTWDCDKENLESPFSFHENQDYSFQAQELSDGLKQTLLFKRKLKELLLFLLGFQTSFLGLGFLLSQLVISSIQNGLKVGLGSFFSIIGTLSILNRLDPLKIPLFSNTFLLGFSFSLLVSLNPCTVPFLAVIITLNITDAFVSLFLFGLGLITPALCIAFLGRSFILFLERFERLHKLMGTIMSFLLVLSGFFLCNSSTIIAFYDSIIASFFLFSGILIAFYHLGMHSLIVSPTSTSAFFRSNVKQNMLRSFSLFILTSTIIFLLLTIFNVRYGIHNLKTHELLSPKASEEICIDWSRVKMCEICQTFILRFLWSSITICVLIIIADFLERFTSNKTTVLRSTSKTFFDKFRSSTLQFLKIYLNLNIRGQVKHYKPFYDL